jgi:hypothetical protein
VSTRQSLASLLEQAQPGGRLSLFSFPIVGAGRSQAIWAKGRTQWEALAVAKDKLSPSSPGDRTVFSLPPVTYVKVGTEIALSPVGWFKSTATFSELD